MMRESPTHNSVRIQKAYRINSVESTRLKKRLGLLEREKLHAIRVTNQQIRQVNHSFEHVHATTGHSALGAAAQYQDPVAENAESFFFYGERTSSRRFGKFRQTSSAPPTKGSSLVRRMSAISLAGSSASDVSGESSALFSRPKSCPPKHSSFADVMDRVKQREKDEADDIRSIGRKGSILTIKQNRTEVTSSQQITSPSRGILKQGNKTTTGQRRKDSFSKISEDNEVLNSPIKQHTIPVIDKVLEENIHEDIDGSDGKDTKPILHARKHRFVDAVNKARILATVVRRFDNKEANDVILLGKTSRMDSEKSTEVLERKKSVQYERTSMTNDKVADFLQKQRSLSASPRRNSTRRVSWLGRDDK